MSFASEKEENEERVRLPLADIWGGVESLEKYNSYGLLGQFLKAALRNITSSPFSSVVTFATIAFSLFLVGTLALVFVNVEGAASSARSSLSARIYFEDKATDAEITAIAKEVSSWKEVEEATLVSKEEALVEFKESLGDESGLIAGLQDLNPLPRSVNVTIKEEMTSTAAFERLKLEYSERAGVEKVDYNRGVVDRLNQALSSFKSMSFGIIVLVLVIVGFVVSNTIVLSVYARRDEIEIMRLVGASSASVRAPYLIEGLIFGAAGSIVSLIVLYSAYSWGGSALLELSLLQAAGIELSFLPFGHTFLLLSVGVLVGFFGSFMAVRRFDEF